MIVKLAGKNHCNDFTLLGECFSVEIEHIPKEELQKPGMEGSPNLPDRIPSPPVLNIGTAYKLANNSIHKDPNWKRLFLSYVNGDLFMVVDVSGMVYVMNDSGKTVDRAI